MQIKLLEQKIELQEEFKEQSSAIAENNEKLIEKWLTKGVQVSSQVAQEQSRVQSSLQQPYSGPSQPIVGSSAGSSVVLFASPVPPISFTQSQPAAANCTSNDHSSTKPKKSKKDKKKKNDRF
jgi:hypothetical protein